MIYPLIFPFYNANLLQKKSALDRTRARDDVARDGLDPPTFGLWARRATAALPRDVWTAKVGQYWFLNKFIGVDVELAQNGEIRGFGGFS